MLPERFQLCSPQLLFRLTEHGSSFTEFWKRIDNAERTILIIKTSTGHIFGVYCSGSWTNRRKSPKRYFGTGETFLFKVDEEMDALHFYPWTRSSPNDMFLAAGRNYLLIGGNGLAITINDELRYASRTDSVPQDQLVPDAKHRASISNLWPSVSRDLAMMDEDLADYEDHEDFHLSDEELY
uniref:TLDc domain-containing protein n=1 Tax=Acrobeloides nanus TaxID=290746 RepID=A0A914EDJ5_9BILA